MSKRLFSRLCPVIRAAPSKKQQKRRAVIVALVLLAGAPPGVAVAVNLAVRAVEAWTATKGGSR